MVARHGCAADFFESTGPAMAFFKIVVCIELSADGPGSQKDNWEIRGGYRVVVILKPAYYNLDSTAQAD